MLISEAARKRKRKSEIRNQKKPLKNQHKKRKERRKQKRPRLPVRRNKQQHKMVWYEMPMRQPTHTIYQTVVHRIAMERVRFEMKLFNSEIEIEIEIV
jgi:hypothetical protein